MNRIPHKSDFLLRLAFSDSEGLPVSMRGVDFEIWFSTKPGCPVYFIAARSGICNSCEILDDGSVLAKMDNHRLSPGQLLADLTIHADDETLPDGCHDINIKPVIPVELTDSPVRPVCKPAGDTGSQPILVNVTIPMRRPNLTHHVTQQELEDALNGFSGQLDIPQVAGQDEIDPILDSFKND